MTNNVIVGFPFFNKQKWREMVNNAKNLNEDDLEQLGDDLESKVYAFENVFTDYGDYLVTISPTFSVYINFVFKCLAIYPNGVEKDITDDGYSNIGTVEELLSNPINFTQLVHDYYEEFCLMDW